VAGSALWRGALCGGERFVAVCERVLCGGRASRRGCFAAEALNKRKILTMTLHFYLQLEVANEIMTRKYWTTKKC
jgi:hypothetical protein